MASLAQAARDCNVIVRWRNVGRMVRVMHAGWCDGGPLAGQQLAHDTNRYRVVVREKIPMKILELLAFAESRGIALDMAREYREVDGEYVWDDGAWRWHEV